MTPARTWSCGRCPRGGRAGRRADARPGLVQAEHHARNTIDLCGRLEPYDITWFEDCLHPENYEGYRVLCRESPIPIAAGEQEATIRGYRQLLSADLGYVQPDLSRCGGLSVAKQVAALAESAVIQVVPHAWLTDRRTATSLHLCLAEHAAYLDNVSAGPLARDLFQEPIALQPDGTLLVPTGPGIVEPSRGDRALPGARRLRRP